MKISSAWIQEWLCRTMLSDQEIVQALERAGIEIEDFVSSKEIDKRVVACSVKKVVQHPGADNLQLVEVTTGEGSYHIVCGAGNVHVGLKTALAQVGSTLPGGEQIKAAKLRGELSEGMLCSARELGVGEDHKGIIELSAQVPDGTPLSELFPADGIIDLKTPANRFDVLSVIGLAREVAAMTTAELAPFTPPAVELPTSPSLPELAGTTPAARYMLAHFAIKPQSTPHEMVARLQASGMRSVSPVVDVTNYLMLETGQPVHAFDSAKVTLPIGVRYAEAGEQLVTLDGVTRKLTALDLIIADANGPIALAGLMGGASTEVDAATTEILLELAVFDSATVRKMGRRHNLRTDASARFERGVPIVLAPMALNRAAELLGQIAQGQLLGWSDTVAAKPSTREIALKVDRLSSLLGFEVTAKAAVAALAKLEIKAQTEGDLVIVPRVPWWRQDIALPEDLIEEVVRVVGYDKVPSTLPAWRPQGSTFDTVRARQREVRDVLFAAGCFEVMTYSFVSEDQLTALDLDPARHLKLQNPLSVEQAYLRSGLLASHLQVLARNRMYAKAFSFYEISKVFEGHQEGEQPNEPRRLAVLHYAPTNSYRALKGSLDLLAAKLQLEMGVQPGAEAATLAPGRQGQILLRGSSIGVIGQVHPSQLRRLKVTGEASYLELDLDALLAAAPQRRFQSQAKFPVMTRDLTFAVEVAVLWQKIRAELAVLAAPVEFVADYYGLELPSGHKNITLRLTVAHPERTPTEPEAEELERRLIGLMERKFNAVRV